MDKETLKNLLAKDASMMSEEEIRDAIKMRRLHFGDFEVQRRVSSGGVQRTFSNICDVFHFKNENEPQQRISPRSGWKIEKAAREVFNRLQIGYYANLYFKNNRKAIEDFFKPEFEAGIGIPIDDFAEACNAADDYARAFEALKAFVSNPTPETYAAYKEQFVDELADGEFTAGFKWDNFPLIDEGLRAEIANELVPTAAGS